VFQIWNTIIRKKRDEVNEKLYGRYTVLGRVAQPKLFANIDISVEVKGYDYRNDIEKI
jgi:hypothetical protein